MKHTETCDIPICVPVINSKEAKIMAVNEKIRFKIKGYDMLYGFISGMCAGNYDITDIFIDSTFKIAGDDKAELSAFVDKLNVLADYANTTITLLISSAKDDLPSDINATLEEL